MRELVYDMTFLSDVVLPATANTEGNITPLAFVPGSNFLGMVAKSYKDFGDSFAVFHSGAVRFGDAMPLAGGKESYAVPFSFFHEKSDTSTYYNHHKIDDFSKFTQLKQKRDGFITEDLETFNIDYNYTQKSAYDKELRKSKDSTMFGYTAMPKGLKWHFKITVDEGISGDDLSLLRKSIEGQQRLGKSRSAQYGLVEITFIEERDSGRQHYDAVQDETLLYLHSRVAMTDEEGNPTLDLKYLFEGISDENIVYDKCQLRTASFMPYNGAMQTKTAERICIEKGSVIVLKDFKGTIPRFVGAYQSEGFGEMLLNPKFLELHDFSLTQKKTDAVSTGDTQDTQPTSNLASFLSQRKQEHEHKLSILSEVDVFISDYKSLYKNIKPSQWGKVRSICTANQENFRGKIRDYLKNGVKKWEEKQIATLLDEKHSLEFIKLVAMQMPKQGGEA